mmetsp:Transcript_222/g.633  ORF Transcript_222/g.633 Transcript_222/m.633 type:complete len:187 (-) Transcript_222:50-610(-)
MAASRTRNRRGRSLLVAVVVTFASTSILLHVNGAFNGRTAAATTDTLTAATTVAPTVAPTPRPTAKPPQPMAEPPRPTAEPPRPTAEPTLAPAPRPAPRPHGHGHLCLLVHRLCKRRLAAADPTRSEQLPTQSWPDWLPTRSWVAGGVALCLALALARLVYRPAPPEPIKARFVEGGATEHDHLFV